MQINMTSNIKDVQKQLNALERKVLPKATNRSLNRVGGKVNTQVLRYVSKKVGLPQKALKQRGFFARVNSNLKTLTTQIRVIYGAIPLKDFNPRQTKQGVTAKAWGKSKVYDGAFVSDTLGRHVFVRKSKARLPIKKLWGAIPSVEADKPELKMIIGKVVEDNMGKELTSNIQFYASKEIQRASRGRG